MQSINFWHQSSKILITTKCEHLQRPPILPRSPMPNQRKVLRSVLMVWSWLYREKEAQQETRGPGATWKEAPKTKGTRSCVTSWRFTTLHESRQNCQLRKTPRRRCSVFRQGWCVLESGKDPFGHDSLRIKNYYQPKIETIECGEEKPRQVISGLVRHIPLEEMQNRMVVLLCNLKPAKMRGIVSEAMVMCASTPDKVRFGQVKLALW